MGEQSNDKTGCRMMRGAVGTCAGDPASGLHERETELAALSASLDAARSGAGGLVLLEGPAGIGKSRLLAEARAAADARGMAVLAARGIDLERDAPFGTVSDLLAGAVGGASATGRVRLLSGQATHAAALFDSSAVPPPADPSAMVRGLYWLTVNLAAAYREDGPGGLLIQVDDAQWADRPSLSYLAYLAARIDELPAVLMVAVRSGERATDQRAIDWLRERTGRALLRPRALSPEGVARMARAELPAADPAFTRACAEVSGGNPFLATELLRALHA
ncbi:MAG: AAA family ATPase, partial [Trebonia sp.]